MRKLAYFAVIVACLSIAYYFAIFLPQTHTNAKQSQMGIDKKPEDFSQQQSQQNNIDYETAYRTYGPDEMEEYKSNLTPEQRQGFEKYLLERKKQAQPWQQQGQEQMQRLQAQTAQQQQYQQQQLHNNIANVANTLADSFNQRAQQAHQPKKTYIYPQWGIGKYDKRALVVEEE